MANILVFNYLIIDTEHLNGNTLRVFNLSRELAKKHRCFLVVLGQEDAEVSFKLRESGVYEDIAFISPPAGQRSFLRYFSLYAGNQARVALPDEHRRVVAILNKLLAEWDIDLILVHTSGLSEFIKPLKEIPCIMDAIDCNSLAIERSLIHEQDTLAWRRMFQSKLLLVRKRHQERNFTEVFDFVTVVSPVDREYLRNLCQRHQERVIDIPNGVGPVFFESREKKYASIPGGIAFWGGLDFPPNTTAVHYFYDEVFVPYLIDKEIVWYIIGGNATRKMQEMAEKHKNIILTGYVDDLYALVSRIPIMINPMLIGGGLKNKVIEAFSLERAVISTGLGMEAITSAEAGVHYVQTETPEEFAKAICKYSADVKARERMGKAARTLVETHYTWEKIGNQYHSLIACLCDVSKKKGFNNVTR